MTVGFRHTVGCTWFWVWAVVGAGVALAAISLGPILLLPVVLLGMFLASRPAARGSAYGLLSGAGLASLFVAYVQRGGPLDPIPWLVAGLALFVAGVVAHARRVA